MIEQKPTYKKVLVRIYPESYFMSEHYPVKGPQQGNPHEPRSCGQQANGQGGSMKRPTGVIVLSLFYFVVAIVILVKSLDFLSYLEQQPNTDPEAPPSNYFWFKVLIPILVLIPMMIGVGLYKRVKTVRDIAMAFATIGLFVFFPIVQLVNGIILIYLVMPEVKAWFAQEKVSGGRAIPKE